MLDDYTVFELSMGFRLFHNLVLVRNKVDTLHVWKEVIFADKAVLKKLPCAQSCMPRTEIDPKVGSLRMPIPQLLPKVLQRLQDLGYNLPALREGAKSVEWLFLSVHEVDDVEHGLRHLIVVCFSRVDGHFDGAVGRAPSVGLAVFEADPSLERRWYALVNKGLDRRCVFYVVWAV
jgi:hypothetical protein